MNVTDFKITARLSPCKGNPRNSEGAFIELSDGRIAYAYSRYCGNHFDDHEDCNICAVFSEDGGESWDTENFVTLVYAKEYDTKNVMSVTLRRMQNGDIGLFYLVKKNDETSDYVLRRYSDDLKTALSDIVCTVSERKGYYIVNNDRVVLLSDGRWIFPCAYHGASYIRYWEKGLDCFFASDDDGKTWYECGNDIVMSDPYTRTGLQEPGVIELPDGTLYAYARTDRMYQYEYFSHDGGKTWDAPRPSRFTSPASPMLIKKNPFNGKYYAIWNPIPNYIGRPEAPYFIWGRTPYVIAESENGLDFDEPFTLENDPKRGFCYPALHFLDEKTALIAYCDGGEAEKCTLNRVAIGKLTLE